MKSIRTLGLLAVMASAAGCASAGAPPELLTARTVYARATHGPAAQLEPADLHSAKKALDEAEQKFDEEGDSQEAKDYAYTAQRRVEIAEARARATQALQLKEKVLTQLHAAQANQAQHATAELGQARQQLASQAQQLQSERQRREEAEKRAAQAAKDLAAVASVKQETRGMVITLSGSVLFASGKADLLPAAQAKLNEVATALSNQDPDSKIVIEGHTDSRGDAALNQELSHRRAQTVADYLVSRGIAKDRVTAIGQGSARAVADNASAEGRANNRRVEIVVRPTGATDPYSSAQ